jgi:UDP-glucose 4-epimerase
MNILVTGGAGFIGSHLVDQLIALGNKVKVLDNISSGKILYINSQSELIKGSINDPLCLKKAFNNIQEFRT